MLNPKFLPTLALSAALLASLFLLACAGGSNGYTSGSGPGGGNGGGSGAQPVASSLSPTSATVNGGVAVTVTIMGSFALQDSLQVFFGGGATPSFTLPPNTQPTSTSLSVTIPNSDLQQPNAYRVQVQDITSGKSSDPYLIFNVLSPVVTISPSSFNAAPRGAPILLNVSVSPELSGDQLTASVNSSPACGGPCGTLSQVSPVTGTPGSYTVQYTPPANVSSPISQTIMVLSNLKLAIPGTATVNLASNAPVVTVTPNPISAVAGGSLVTLDISVANDVANDQLTASVTSAPVCGGPCGTLGPVSPVAGTPGSYTVQYTPPATIQQATSQTIAVSSSVTGATPGTTTVDLTSSGVLCPAQGNEALMTGTYAFLATGFDGANPMVIGATFTVDGSTGLVTTGTMDINVVGSTPQTNLPVNTGSTYSVDSKGQACIGLVTSARTKVFHAALASYVTGVATEGQIEEFDDTTGTGGRALGFLKQQDQPAWSNASLNAPYVFGLSGWNATGGRVSGAGSITFDGAGNIKNGGLGDANDAGILATAQTIPGGTYTLAADGRGTISFVIGGSTVDGAIYAVKAGELFLLSTSPVGTSTPLVSGRVLAAVVTPSLSEASDIGGNQLVTLSGSNDATIGILNLSLGKTTTGNVSGTLWQYAGGASSQAISGAFTITDPAHYRVAFSIPGSPVAYFTGFSKLAGQAGQVWPTTAFLVGTGNDAESGEVIWQSASATNFSASQFNYSASYSKLQGSGNRADAQTTSVGQVTFDGTSTFTGVADVSSPAPALLGPGTIVSGAYAVNADGSGTITPAGSTSPWPMVTNGVRSYFINQLSGNTTPVVNVIAKQ